MMMVSYESDFRCLLEEIVQAGSIHKSDPELSGFGRGRAC